MPGPHILPWGGDAMMERNKTGRDPSDPLVWDTEELASATECTGLVPSAIQTPEEAEDYSRLYAIHQQKPAWNQGKIKDENE